MKVEELRIGNWVKIKDSIFNEDKDKYFGYSTNAFQIRGWNDGSHREGCKQIAYYSIKEDTFGGKVNSGVYDIDIDPIKLTEEVFLTFGFTKNDNNYWFHPMVTNSIYGSNGFYMSNVTPEIKYVHQLQNLYFALTGEELELKDKLTTK